jgi:hypothetical protein
MKQTSAITLLATTLLVSLHGSAIAQGASQNQARADAELNRQKSESRTVQRRNEMTDKDERAQFEARKKAYEQEDRRKEDQQKRDAVAKEKLLQKAEPSEKRTAGKQY